MAIRTMVAILEPEPNGPGSLVGTGSLIRPRSVLVHPPLSHALAAGGTDAAGLRVCAVSWAGGTIQSRIVGVEGAVFANAAWATAVGATTAARNPLVSLTLAAAVPVALVTGPLGVRSIIAHLADPFDGSAVAEVPPGTDILCTLFGVCCD